MSTYDFDDEPRRGSASRNSANRSSANRNSSSRANASRGNASRSNAGSSNRRPSNTGSKKRKKKKMKRTILIVEIVIVIVLILALVLWMKFGRANWDTTIDMADIEVNDLDPETEEILSNYTTIALFGVDNRTNGNYSSGNSDSMMIAAINNDTKEVNIVSVMRDTYLEVDEDTYRKCNYAYNHGGPELAISMLNKNLDLQVSGYVAVDFYALAEVVDDLGGIEVEITQAMVDAVNPETGGPALAGYIAEVQTVIGDVNEDEWYLSAGTQTLNGSQIVGYCRNRYSGGDDYSRTERQREVVKKIVEKAVNSKASTLNKIIDDVLPDVSTSLTAAQVLSMATSASEYNINATSGFPFDLTTGTYGKKGSLVVPCTLTDNVAKLHEFLYAQTDYDTTDAVDTISAKIQSDTSTDASSATVNQVDD